MISTAAAPDFLGQTRLADLPSENPIPCAAASHFSLWLLYSDLPLTHAEGKSHLSSFVFQSYCAFLSFCNDDQQACLQQYISK